MSSWSPIEENDAFTKNIVIRAVKSLNPQIDKAIENLRKKFNSLLANFDRHAALDTSLQVYMNFDIVQDIGKLRT